MAAAAVVVLWVHGRRLRAAWVGAAAWLPVGLYAVFSRHHGGFWLPNSVSIKGIRVAGRAGPLHGALAGLADHAARAPHLVLLALALALMACGLWRRQKQAAGLLAVLAGASALQLLVADVGWAFRYESFLVGAALVVIAGAWPAFRTMAHGGLRAGVVAALSLALLVLMLRSYLAATELPQYAQAISLQQWQTARFLATAYPGARVAANDIGAINFNVDLHCTDLAGLATASVFEAKRKGVYTTAFLEQLAADRHLEIAVVYDDWFSDHPAVHSVLTGPPLPANWTRIRRWTVPVKHQLGSRTLSWYAVDPAEAPRLRERLHAFEPTLPAMVSVSD